ncbi:MAG: glycosyltransferase family 4 protein [Desulfatibacillaceae bacterium]
MTPRVVMLIQGFAPYGNGAELQAERLARKLLGLGHRVHVVTNRLDGSSPVFENSGGLAVWRTREPLAYHLQGDYLPLFPWLVRHRRHYDVLHSHMGQAHAMVAAAVARWFNKRTVAKIACNGEFGDLCAFTKNRRAAWGMRLLRQTDALIAPSRLVERELADWGFFRDRVHHIPNGVDPVEFRPPGRRPPPRPFRFLFVGRFAPQKGVDVLLRAMRVLAAQRPGDDFRLSLVGRGVEGYDYRTLASEQGIADRLDFSRFTDDMPAVYGGHHCVVLPSRAEGLSNVLLEAMACGAPVVATKVSGSTDVVVHGENGLLARPGDPGALAAAMARVLDHPRESRVLGARARQTVAANYSLDEVARRYSALYHRLCGLGGQT